MPRVTTSGGWSQANDAAFRAWLAECEQMLADCGLVRTADTGQINPATATIPATNATMAGYSMWRFDDALQATAPVFIKVEYGRNNSAANLLGVVTVGTATDGAGNITGLTSGAGSIGSVAPAAGVFSSYAVHREGLAALAFKVGGIGASSIPFSFLVQRTVDNTGTPTASGVLVIRPGGAIANPASVCRLRFTPTSESTGFQASNVHIIGFVPGGITDGRVGLSPQVFPHWIALPKQAPLVGSAGAVRGEIAQGQEFTMTLVGGAARNYINVGTAFSSTLAGVPNTDTILLWED